MNTAASHRQFRFVRAAICTAIAGWLLLSSVGCSVGKLFGRKEPEQPQTMQQFLALKRPK